MIARAYLLDPNQVSSTTRVPRRTRLRRAAFLSKIRAKPRPGTGPTRGSGNIDKLLFIGLGEGVVIKVVNNYFNELRPSMKTPPASAGAEGPGPRAAHRVLRGTAAAMDARGAGESLSRQVQDRTRPKPCCVRVYVHKELTIITADHKYSAENNGLGSQLCTGDINTV